MGLFSRKKKDDDQSLDPDERSPQLGLKHKDLLLLGQIMQSGTDLTRPRHVVYFSYAPDPATQQAMAAEAGARGFDVTADEPLPDYPDDWPVRCETVVTLRPEVVRDNTDWFEALAARHGAEFDGWEAALDPS
jgi:hypothetical protein